MQQELEAMVKEAGGCEKEPAQHGRGRKHR